MKLRSLYKAETAVPVAKALHREKFIEYGGPDGGNGGKGGDLYFECVKDLNTPMIDFRYNQHFKAQKGYHGMGRACTANGEDMIVKVPCWHATSDRR